MAWKMSFTDQYGDVWANSYWKVVQYNSSIADGNGVLLLYGYPDEARKGLRIIGQKRYPLSAGDLAGLVGQAIPNPIPNGVSTIQQLLISTSYTWTLSKLDTPDGNGGLKSFFDGAVAV